MAPLDSPEPTFMDPEENLPPERRTADFFDNLFDTASAPSRTPAPMVKEEPEAPAPQSEDHHGGGLESGAGTCRRQRPLQADFLANSVFRPHGAFVAISFIPPTIREWTARSALRAALKRTFPNAAESPSPFPSAGFSVPEPVQEELAQRRRLPPCGLRTFSQTPGAAGKTRRVPFRNPPGRK
ncbi:MAG: hypothetical protein ACLT8E_05310 [Akkermansia sp.]